MKTRLVAPAMAVLVLGAGTSPVSAQTFMIDPAHTDIVFMVSHFGYSDTIGRFNDVAGTIVMDGEDLANSAIQLKIDAASLDTNHAERDRHLRSPDFFNVAEFPTITFESTAVKKTGDQTGQVTGDLTMLGITRPVTLDVTLNKLAPHPLPAYDGVTTAGFSARGTINRADFGMETFAPAIGEEVDLILELEAMQEGDKPS